MRLNIFGHAWRISGYSPAHWDLDTLLQHFSDMQATVALDTLYILFIVRLHALVHKPVACQIFKLKYLNTQILKIQTCSFSSPDTCLLPLATPRSKLDGPSPFARLISQNKLNCLTQPCRAEPYLKSHLNFTRYEGLGLRNSSCTQVGTELPGVQSKPNI